MQQQEYGLCSLPIRRASRIYFDYRNRLDVVILTIVHAAFIRVDSDRRTKMLEWAAIHAPELLP